MTVHAACDEFVATVVVKVISIRHGAIRPERGDCLSARILQHIASCRADVCFHYAVAVHVGECQGRSLTALRRNLDVHTLRLEIRPGSCEL